MLETWKRPADALQPAGCFIQANADLLRQLSQDFDIPFNALRVDHDGVPLPGRVVPCCHEKWLVLGIAHRITPTADGISSRHDLLQNALSNIHAHTAPCYHRSRGLPYDTWPCAGLPPKRRHNPRVAWVRIPYNTYPDLKRAFRVVSSWPLSATSHPPP